MAVFLSPVGGAAAQFFDNNGIPLAGGLIYTYAAGTSTPAATYTTSSGLIQHSNPIILDASGRVPTGEIWLGDTLAYKFVVKDYNDVLIATYDNITGINSNFVAYTAQQEIQAATAGQTVFTLTTMQYQPGTNNLSVFVDGVNQYGPGAQYAFVETDSETVTFVTGLHVGASVKFTTASSVSTNVTDAANVSYTPPFAGSVTTNVETKLSEYVSVKDFGAVGDGVTDDASAIQAALDASATVFFPVGNYLIVSKIDLNTGNVLNGNGATITWDASDFANAIEGTDVTDVEINGLKFVSSVAVTASEAYAIKLTNVQQAKISDCKTELVNLIIAAASTTTYADVVTDETNPSFNCSADILVEHCIVDGPGNVSQASQGGIYMQYVQRFAIDNCIVKNAGHGIEYIGGDSNPAVNGAVANERKCKHGTISNCVVENVNGGGIWGGMGDGIVVTGCTIKTCDDVGIDFEGSNNCTAVGNYVSDCANGGLTNFFFCRGITFSGNSVTQSDNSYPLYRCYNSSNSTDNKSVSLIGNTFVCTDTDVSTVDFANGPAETINITGNTFINVVLSVYATNLKYVNIIGNSILLPTANSVALTGIRLNGVVAGTSNIKNNIVASDVTQPSGSAGIFVSGDDYNNANVHTIESNTTRGFDVDIKTDNYGTNAGVTVYFNILNNNFGVPVYTRAESGTSTSVVNVANNTFNAQPFPYAVPSTGRWDVGTKIYYVTPTAGGYIGSVCTTAGTPGTWKTFGAISA